MKTTGRIGSGALALALLCAGPRTGATEPSIPLRVSLTIPEICTIGATAGPGLRAGAEGDAPSVNCVHGTPFLLSHAPAPGATRSPHGLGAGAPAAWTVTF
ncbi:hypothetical protein GQ57_11310 [Burkholderia sp. MSh2]|uniref:Lipoprotein n=1 Tax=Burkholderia paludis TaxID=1506587 RepID=A0A6P2P7C0_9BURK|nr:MULTISPECIES: hypothetical protein [Burkholderia]KEZ05729.1 hypothetical protein GQ57_11310 [Burkholderia sp. MSh2]CAB3762501.1 hypothetical protein LMG30113_04210 [Burkholderia paludis]VWC03120.1 hypothetical protein BPA30113_04841 [Burkholderia paludis]